MAIATNTMLYVVDRSRRDIKKNFC